jgi:hypothetical protein
MWDWLEQRTAHPSGKRGEQFLEGLHAGRSDSFASVISNNLNHVMKPKTLNTKEFYFLFHRRFYMYLGANPIY